MSFVKSELACVSRQMLLTHRLSNDSLPGAIGMYGLSLGVQQIGDTLPDIVYALLSGLNASTVGIIALAAVQVLHSPELSDSRN